MAKKRENTYILYWDFILQLAERGKGDNIHPDSKYFKPEPLSPGI